MKRLRTLAGGLWAAFTVTALTLTLAGAGHAGGPEEPDRFLLRFTDAHLVYEVDGGAPQIATEGNVLSYGQDWEIIRVREFLYHMRQRNWQNFYWKVNTSRREAYRVRGGAFGELDGEEERIGSIAVDPVGDANDPARFFLRFDDAYLVHAPDSGTLQIAAAGNVLSYGSDWTADQVEPWIYTLRQDVWRGFHWKVNTAREIAYRVKDETDPCLTDARLDMGVDVVGGGAASLAYGCVYSAVERPEDEAYPRTNPLADIPAAEVVGKDRSTATAPAAMVRVRALTPDADSTASITTALSLYGSYDLFLPAGSAREVLFEITDAATGERLHRSGAEPLSGGVERRHLLVPGEAETPGSIPFPSSADTGVFTRVGFVDLADIDAQGFAAFSDAPARMQDAPFGGSLRLFGAFTRTFYPQSGTGDYCYRIRLSGPDGSSDYLDDPLIKRRYVVRSAGDVAATSEFLGPTTIGAVEDCYRLTPLSSDPGSGDPAGAIAVFWSSPDLLAHWRTGIRSGAHALTLELYDTTSGGRVRLVTNDNLTAELFLDNRPITLRFDAINVVEGGAAQTDLLDERCAIARLADGRRLEFDFTALHPSGFLSAYHLTARSNSGVRTWREGDSYTAPGWSGSRPPAFEGRAEGEPSFTKTAADFTAGPCAYVLDLRAAARTTDGYSRINRAHRRLFYFIDP